MKFKTVFLPGISRFFPWRQGAIRPATILADGFDCGGSALLAEVGTSKKEFTGSLVQVPETMVDSVMLLEGWTPSDVEMVPAKTKEGEQILVPEFKGKLPKEAVAISVWPGTPSLKYWEKTL